MEQRSRAADVSTPDQPPAAPSGQSGRDPHRSSLGEPPWKRRGILRIGKDRRSKLLWALESGDFLIVRLGPRSTALVKLMHERLMTPQHAGDDGLMTSAEIALLLQERLEFDEPGSPGAVRTMIERIRRKLRDARVKQHGQEAPGPMFLIRPTVGLRLIVPLERIEYDS